jgi:SAM-dependent methyltransferase
MLAKALNIKNVLFAGVIDGVEDKSPKRCALQELGIYLKRPEQEIEKSMVVEEPVGEDWIRRGINPSDPESVLSFYRETDSYLYELMAANHIIQTLFTFAVMTERLKKLHVRTVLDYGGGIGTLSILLAQSGFDVTYADLPSQTADFAKWRFEKRNLSIPVVELGGNERTDLSSPSLSEKDFDCILSTEVFEHVSKPLDLIQSFAEKLRPKGVAVVSESCEYTEQFASHLEQNKQYGGEEFIHHMKKVGLEPYPVEFFTPQQIFIKK